jgi:hypothetical protein
MRTTVFVLCLGLAVAASAQQWSPRLVNITGRKGKADEGTPVKLRIDQAQGMLLVDKGKSPLYDIPFRAVVRLSHDTQVRNAAAAYGSSSGGCGGNCLGELALLAALTPFHTRWEYLTVDWRDRGVSRTTILRFGAGDFVRFERSLADAAGFSIENAAADRAALATQIAKAPPLSIRLDGSTFIRNEPVRGGEYRLLVLEREPPTGTLYLFHGAKVDPKKLSWAVPVSITPTADDHQSPEPEYTNTGGGWSKKRKNLEAIRIPGRVVRILR